MLKFWGSTHACADFIVLAVADSSVPCVKSFVLHCNVTLWRVTLEHNTHIHKQNYCAFYKQQNEFCAVKHTFTNTSENTSVVTCQPFSHFSKSTLNVYTIFVSRSLVVKVQD